MKKSGTPVSRRTVLNSSAAAMALAATPLGKAAAQAPAAAPHACPRLTPTGSPTLTACPPRAMRRWTRSTPVTSTGWKRPGASTLGISATMPTPISMPRRSWRMAACTAPSASTATWSVSIRRRAALVWSYRHNEKGRRGAPARHPAGAAPTGPTARRNASSMPPHQLSAGLHRRQDRACPIRSSARRHRSRSAQGLGSHRRSDSADRRASTPRRWSCVTLPWSAMPRPPPARAICSAWRRAAPASANGSSTTVPQKGEFGYDTWQAGQAETATNTGVWAMMAGR